MKIDLSSPLVMAIVNITTDSFFSGSRLSTHDAIVRRIREAVGQGADLLDIGGYSSRPGAEDVSPQEEWRRIEQGLDVAREEAPGVPVSIDTFRGEVAHRAIEKFGDLIINDISAGELDPSIVEVAAHYDVPYIAMHMRGTPADMQTHTHYENIVDEVLAHFDVKISDLHRRGVYRVILDPGFGFAKTLEQNYELLAALPRLVAKGYPVLSGVSRKSMIYNLLEKAPEQALAGTIALGWESLRQGAMILRVHDVQEAADTVKIFKLYDQSLRHSQAVR